MALITINTISPNLPPTNFNRGVKLFPYTISCVPCVLKVGALVNCFVCLENNTYVNGYAGMRPADGRIGNIVTDATALA